jgi:hypothetical protein
VRTATLLFLLAGAACSYRGDTASSRATDAGQSWFRWHDDKREVDRAVDAAINEPGGGDYAKAADLIRRSSRPDAVKQFQVGQLVVDAATLPSPKRPPETLEQGMRMMEDASIAPGERSEANVQYLRMLFERGAGSGLAAVPKDGVVAACWRSIERRENDDRARCIALRRQRLPNIGG